MQRRHVVLGTFVAATLGCVTRATIGTTDDTPPTVELYYHLEGESWELVESDQSVEVSPNESIYLCAIGEDPDGLLRLTLEAKPVLIGCAGGSLTFTGYSEFVQAPGGTSFGDTARTERTMTHSIPMYEVCSGGPWSGKIEVTATALNFHTLRVVSPTLNVSSE